MAAKLSLPPLSPSKDHAGYPLLSGAISRWLWRVYSQRLTTAGRWLLLATAVFVGYGGTSLQLQGYMLAGYAAALWLVAGAAVFFYKPHVTLTAHLCNRVCAGETLPIDIDLQQRGRARGADLVILPHRLPAPIDSVPEQGILLPDLPRGQRTRIRLGLRCTRRGAYTLKGFRVESGFPFNI